MIPGIKSRQEIQHYDRILGGWNNLPRKEKDGRIWFSRSILSLLEEDRKKILMKAENWNKIMTNCLVLILALANLDEIALHSEIDFYTLSANEKHQYLLDLAAHFGVC